MKKPQLIARKARVAFGNATDAVREFIASVPVDREFTSTEILAISDFRLDTIAQALRRERLAGRIVETRCEMALSPRGGGVPKKWYRKVPQKVFRFI